MQRLMTIMLSLYLIFLMSSGGCSAAEIMLTMLGPGNGESVVTLCPDQNYTIVFECKSSNSDFLSWTLDSILSAPETFDFGDNLGRFDDEGVTFILSDIKTTVIDSLTSQILIPTANLINTSTSQRRPLDLTCIGSENAQRTISIQVAGGDPPLIKEAFFSGQSLFVNWSTIIDDVVTVVTATNTKSGKYISVTAEKDKREAFINDIDIAASYDVVVEIFDCCGRNFSSQRFPVNGTLPLITPSKPSSSSSLSPQQITPSMACFPSEQSDNDAAEIGLGISLAFVMVLLSIIIPLCVTKPQIKD